MKATPTLLLILTISLMLPVGSAWAEGLIVRVVDGDTYDVRFGDQVVKTRLVNADTPEIGSHARCPEEREAGQRASVWVRELVASRRVEVHSLGRLDRHKRLLVRVTVDGRDLGELLVREGLGRFYGGERRMTWCPER